MDYNMTQQEISDYNQEIGFMGNDRLEDEQYSKDVMQMVERIRADWEEGENIIPF